MQASSENIDDIPQMFLAEDRVSVDETLLLTPRRGIYSQRRSVTVPTLDFNVDLGRDESCVAAIRHVSGALSFHIPHERFEQRRGSRFPEKTTARFLIPVRSRELETERRGAVSKIIKLIILKVSGKIADAILPVLAEKWERNSWNKRGLTEGVVKIDQASLLRGKLMPIDLSKQPPSEDRSLLFIHGTFSDAATAFKALAKGDFFTSMASLYGDRMYALDHFTVSRTPAENARALLQALPARAQTFDVVTHSRGGLVLRNLVENRTQLGQLADRFRIGRAVLVASPNEGTPLATPDHWEETVGWIANLMELFPENPFTFGVEMIAESIVWLAQRASGGLPGLHSMDSNGELIRELQDPPGPPANTYSALVSNYVDDGSFGQRMLDLGVSALFRMPNDLVVPTEGGWRVDHDGTVYISAQNIGCFGLGGNLFPDEPWRVNHMNFFEFPETADFIVRTLKGMPTSLATIDPGRALPGHSLMRRDGALAPVVRHAAQPASLENTETSLSIRSSISPSSITQLPEFNSDFQLVVLPHTANGQGSQILATFGSARVLEPFLTKGEQDEAGMRFHDIIGQKERIRKYVDGDPSANCPKDADLIDFGKLLFAALFTGKVRHLYDVARSTNIGRRLNITFTCMIPWVADLPWEFAYDPMRKTYLATEEIHFVRNVLTAIPAELALPKEGQLRILVAVAQPVGLGRLSAEEEVTVIKRGFGPLVETDLVTVEVIPRATPSKLHSWVSTGQFDVVHFIGHGTFEEGRGYLVFEDGSGLEQKVNDRTMREILCQRQIKLVFLNACDTARGNRGDADFNQGIAPALVAGGLPAVVANQFKVLDLSATAFAQRFYWAIARGMGLGEAAKEARIAVNYSLSGESIDWAVPVLYARDPSLRLIKKPTSVRGHEEAPLFSRKGRRATLRHATRIAVWDVSYVFPQLEDTLEKLNHVQNRFGFEVVDISVPLGTFVKVKSKLGDEEAFLYADAVAERLKYKPKELGVDFLMCITTQPMMQATGKEIIYYIYNWWDAGKIGLFSAYGFGLYPQGVKTDRTIANAVVQFLTGTLTNSGTHKRGPKTCPLYFNPDRKFDLLSGPQKFDKSCRAKLAKSIPDEMPALEAILKVF